MGGFKNICLEVNSSRGNIYAERAGWVTSEIDMKVGFGCTICTGNQCRKIARFSIFELNVSDFHGKVSQCAVKLILGRLNFFRVLNSYYIMNTNLILKVKTNLWKIKFYLIYLYEKLTKILKNTRNYNGGIVIYLLTSDLVMSNFMSLIHVNK